MATAEEKREEADEEKGEEEPLVVYKTKVVQFLGRSIPIILQNDNGPCPLLAICNVLLLRNYISLSLDTSEVSLQKLLSLIAERLIDSNSNVENKDDGYVHNQQQNISDAIDLLPRLATGIDVNVQFRKINDFEFTRECAIFDLLDIGLYHGWILDPQDTDTASVIGLKSYNTLVGELVELETRNLGGQDRSLQDEDCVDFAAATTAALGVPSPCLSRGRSFDDTPVSVSGEQRGRRGDIEEEEELMRALKLSSNQVSMPVNESLSAASNLSMISSEETTHFNCSGSGVHAESSLEGAGDESEVSRQSELLVSQACSASNNLEDDIRYSESFSMEEDTSLLKIAPGDHIGRPISEGSGDFLISSDSKEITRTYKDPMNGYEEDQSVSKTCLEDNSIPQVSLKPPDDLGNSDLTVFSGQPASDVNYHSSDGRRELLDVTEGVSPSLDDSEPIYEGEECILDPGFPVYENREPVYEGEMILAEQSESREGDAYLVHPEGEATQQQSTASCSISSADGLLIRNFLRNNASQLTIYGLFCLQEGLKERELCVFFRNNHFSTMFKFNGELYLLATDQGYINQPDLVWEKLNEVNGDTVFMTGNFKEFKAGTQVNDPWDEQNAMTPGAVKEYIATLEGSGQGISALNSDLQLALALQEQEFQQQPLQPQRQQPQNLQQSSGSSRSRLITGPQVQRNSPRTPHRHDSKSKDKCIVM